MLTVRINIATILVFNVSICFFKTYEHYECYLKTFKSLIPIAAYLPQLLSGFLENT